MSFRRAFSGAFATLLAAALVTVTAGLEAPPSDDNATDSQAVEEISGELSGELSGGLLSGGLLKRYNERDIGSPGMRRIRLELRDRGVLSRRFDIAHAWQGQGDEIRSLVLLEEPLNLRGTDYLLVEGAPSATGIEVYLHLPAGQRQVLTILPARFDEGLLGSDFGYTDLLWRIPLIGRRVHDLGPSTIGGVAVNGFEVAPQSPEARASTTWDRARYYLRGEPALLIAAEYYRDEPGRPPAAQPVKRLQIEGWQRRGSVWTPTRMVMQVGRDRTSTLTLRETRFGVEPLAADLFRPAALPELSETLRQGAIPEFLSELAR